MPDIRPDMEELEAFILDMDGVLFIGGSPIEGSKEFVEYLKKSDKKLVFLTNNSSKTREDYVQKLSGFGLDVDKSEILPSSYATALYLSEDDGAGVYVIGEEGLKIELENAGLEVLSRAEAEKADYVVVGMDRDLTYEKIWAGLTAILSGAKFIATNPDPTYPTEKGLAPGAGASIGALSYSAEREPSKIIGKPSSYMIEASLDITGVPPERTAIVGDRIDMDVRAGKKSGLTTILVLTGVDSEENVREVYGTAKAPDYVFPDLTELFER